MKIKKSGFYKLIDFKENIIEIEKNISVTLFDNGKFDKKIFVGKKSEVYICGLLEKQDNYKIEVFQKEKKSKVFLNYLLFSENKENLKVKIFSKIESDFSESNLDIVSFASKNGEIDLDGVLEFEKGFSKMIGKLEEENIFLGEGGKIRGVPTLLVKSSDVKAKHSCKIHKINDLKLFYLRSRGIKEENALFLLIQAKIQNTFNKIKEFDKKFFAKICKSIIFR